MKIKVEMRTGQKISFCLSRNKYFLSIIANALKDETSKGF